MNANEPEYYYFNLCLFVFIRGFPYPFFYLCPDPNDQVSINNKKRAAQGLQP